MIQVSERAAEGAPDAGHTDSRIKEAIRLGMHERVPPIRRTSPRLTDADNEITRTNCNKAVQD